MHILQQYIKDNDLNLIELALLLNYDSGNLSRIINNINGVSPKFAKKVKEKLNIILEPTPKKERPKRYNIIKEEPNNNIQSQNQDPKDVKLEELETALKILTIMYVKECKSNQEKDRIIEELLKPNSREVG